MNYFQYSTNLNGNHFYQHVRALCWIEWQTKNQNPIKKNFDSTRKFYIHEQQTNIQPRKKESKNSFHLISVL